MINAGKLCNFFFLFFFYRLVSTEVASLDDVYWFEDTKASQVLGKDWSVWSKARQQLPTSKSLLDSLKADLWSTVVKSSQHQDAWTWGRSSFLPKKNSNV
jgi:apoptosis-resistant E3 ubiquitin protein ligase 1